MAPWTILSLELFDDFQLQIHSKSLKIGEMAHFRSSASNASHLSAASQTIFRGILLFVERLFGPNSPPEGLLIPQ
jgi:hypothetical protein